MCKPIFLSAKDAADKLDQTVKNIQSEKFGEMVLIPATLVEMTYAVREFPEIVGGEPFNTCKRLVKNILIKNKGKNLPWFTAEEIEDMLSYFHEIDEMEEQVKKSSNVSITKTSQVKTAKRRLSSSEQNANRPDPDNKIAKPSSKSPCNSKPTDKVQVCVKVVPEYDGPTHDLHPINGKSNGIKIAHQISGCSSGSTSTDHTPIC